MSRKPIWIRAQPGYWDRAFHGVVLKCLALVSVSYGEGRADGVMARVLAPGPCEGLEVYLDPGHWEPVAEPDPVPLSVLLATAEVEWIEPTCRCEAPSSCPEFRDYRESSGPGFYSISQDQVLICLRCGGRLPWSAER